MTIYFVNKNSKAKSPFGILDACGRRFIKMGDVLVRDSPQGLALLLVCNSNDSWSACKCIASAPNMSISIDSNALLYSFDGISQRRGRLDLLINISQIFEDDIVKSFFENAIDILNYTKDLWNVEVFHKIQSHTAVEFDSVSKVKKNEVKIGDSSPTIFVSYLSEKSRGLFDSLYLQGWTIRDIYEFIRKELPAEFRESLRSFLIDHPNLNIYQK